MNKFWIVALLILGICSCTTKDASYYRTHPKELEQAIKNCPNSQPEGVSCQKLEEIAIRINKLARELQYSPQGFGTTILQLQTKIASQQAQLQKNASDKQLQASLEKNKRELQEHLAIVRWLESPES